MADSSCRGQKRLPDAGVFPHGQNGYWKKVVTRLCKGALRLGLQTHAVCCLCVLVVAICRGFSLANPPNHPVHDLHNQLYQQYLPTTAPTTKRIGNILCAFANNLNNTKTVHILVGTCMNQEMQILPICLPNESLFVCVLCVLLVLANPQKQWCSHSLVKSCARTHSESNGVTDNNATLCTVTKDAMHAMKSRTRHNDTCMNAQKNCAFIKCTTKTPKTPDMFDDCVMSCDTMFVFISAPPRY